MGGEPDDNERTPRVANMPVCFGFPTGVDQQVQEHMELPEAGFLSDVDVWSWFRAMQMQYPSLCGANDHPYKGDPRQHALGTKLKNRVGSTFTIVGSSFRTSCG